MLQIATSEVTVLWRERKKEKERVRLCFGGPLKAVTCNVPLKTPTTYWKRSFSDNHILQISAFNISPAQVCMLQVTAQ